MQPAAPSVRGRLLPIAVLAAGAFLTDLGGVVLVDRLGSRSDRASDVAVQGSAVAPAGRGAGALGPAGSGTSVAREAYLPCRSGAQRFCVIDGDTIRHNGSKIRLADIDTPEISDPKCASEAALGHRAKARLLDLLNAGPFEIVQPGGRDEDVYGRKLRVLVREGRSLGAILVDEGLARPWKGRRRSWCA